MLHFTLFISTHKSTVLQILYKWFQTNWSVKCCMCRSAVTATGRRIPFQQWPERRTLPRWTAWWGTTGTQQLCFVIGRLFLLWHSTFSANHQKPAGNKWKHQRTVGITSAFSCSLVKIFLFCLTWFFVLSSVNKSEFTRLSNSLKKTANGFVFSHLDVELERRHRLLQHGRPLPLRQLDAVHAAPVQLLEAVWAAHAREGEKWNPLCAAQPKRLLGKFTQHLSSW